jgi:hypothetical protein
MDGRPHLFSSSVAFVGAEHVARMARLVAAVERVVALPAYRPHVLGCAAEIGAPCTRPRRAASFLAMTSTWGKAGPQLIEINTNAGGGLLNAVAGAGAESLLRRRRRPCCRATSAATRPSIMFLDMFRAEWRAFADAAGNLRALCAASPSSTRRRATQYLYPEFVLFQRLFEQAGIPRRDLRSGRTCICATVRCGTAGCASTWCTTGSPISASTRPPMPDLRAAWLADAALLTPHPQAHALYADKRNLVTHCATRPCWKRGASMPETRAILARPRSRAPSWSGPHMADELWARRKAVVLQAGGRLRLEGGLSRRQDDQARVRGYPRRQLHRPGPGAAVLAHAETWARRRWSSSSTCATMSMPGHVQLIAARLWQGQTTNFRTPGRRLCAGAHGAGGNTRRT